MPRYALIDDSDPGLVYHGQWEARTNDQVDESTPEYNRTYHSTTDPHASISYTFSTAIEVFGTIDAPAEHGYPNATFTVTSSTSASSLTTQFFNQTHDVPRIEDLANTTSHITFFKSGALPSLAQEQTYTMTLNNTSVGGSIFYLDFLRVLLPDLPPSQLPKSMIAVDDSDGSFNLIGGWKSGNHTGDYLNTGSETPHGGGSAELTFYGTSIRVYGTLNGAYNGDNPIAYVNITGEGAPEEDTIFAKDVTEISGRPNAPLRNQLIYSAKGMKDLGDQARTLTITVPRIVPATVTNPDTAATVSNPSWFLDFAVYGPYGSGSAASSSSSGSVGDASAGTPASSSPPTGAIAGGVIGAIALIGALVAAVILWRRRKKAEKRVRVKEVYSFHLDGRKGESYAMTDSANASRTPTSATAITPSFARRSSIHKDPSYSDQGSGLPQLSGQRQPMDQQHYHSGESGDGTGVSNPRNAADSHYTRATMAVPPVTAASPISPISATDTRTMQSATVDTNSDSGSRNARRETDGGVRLATSEYGSSIHGELLPPRYAQYD